MHSVTMPRRRPSRCIACSSRVVRTAPVAPIAPARADSNDIVLNRLSVEQPDGTFIGQNAELRSLASQLGVVLAPRLNTPADTLIKESGMMGIARRANNDISSPRLEKWAPMLSTSAQLNPKYR